MREIIEVLNALKGKYVDIYTTHTLFGGQHIKMILDPEVDLGVGFRCNGQVIYIERNDILGYCKEKNGITINGNMMTIRIVK